ncbi:MAG: porin family protein [Candidatus Cryptobacteroides sp.]
MKKIILSAVLAIATAVVASAQIGSTRFGVTAGFTSSSASSIKDLDMKSVSQYNVGVTLEIPLIAGLTIQPGLVYQVKGASLDVVASDITGAVSTVDTKVGYLEVPVQVQYGLDLLLLRPYVFAEPFVGINVNPKTDFKLASITNSFKGDDTYTSRLEYGLGVGAGVEVWKLQLSVRYFWNFGNLFDENGKLNDVAGEVAESVFKENTNFKGLTINLAYFF